MSHSTITWLMDTCVKLLCSPSFAKALNEQLASHAKALAGVDLDDGQYGLVPPESATQYTQSNIGYFNTDLVGPGGIGYPVTIGWRCVNHSDERIVPSEDIHPDCQLEVFWMVFPVEELRRSGHSMAPPEEMNTHFTFDVEWQTHGWPDILLALEAKHAYTDDEIAQIDKVISETIVHWNAQNHNEGLIHYRSALRRDDENRVEVHIDFGSASRNALTLILQNVQDMVEPSLFQKVIVAG